MISRFSKLCLAVAIVLVGGCAFNPKPMAPEDQQALLMQDRIRAQKDVEPVGAFLSMNEAVARGLKYNLDHRSKMLEQAIALGTYQLSNYDMLPKVLATAGYNYRNNWFITNATNSVTGQPSLSDPFISSAKDWGQLGLNLNWSLLDFGVSYFNAKQNADRVLVAAERRRRTMHVLVQDIQVAYLRAAAAQKLKADLIKTIADANEAINNSKTIEKDGLRSPLEALRYQKSLLDNVKILETIDQELATAKVELNQLINLPATANFKLEDPERIRPPNAYVHTDTREFEVRALAFNADLNESIYNARIAVDETRKSMLKLIPGLTFNIGPQTANNSYYINKNWVEGAANISFNLWNIITAPSAIKLAGENEDLAEHKRMMVQMAVISQVYLSKMQLEASLQIYKRSDEIDKVDNKIAKMTAEKEREGSASKAERVAADASAIVSRLRKYQALSQLFAASGKMQATAGLEPDIQSLHDTSLKDLSETIRQSMDAWNSGNLPLLPQSPVAAKEEVRQTELLAETKTERLTPPSTVLTAAPKIESQVDAPVEVAAVKASAPFGKEKPPEAVSEPVEPVAAQKAKTTAATPPQKSDPLLDKINAAIRKATTRLSSTTSSSSPPDGAK